MTLHIRTPLLHSLPMSARLGKTVWLKMEALQPCGSFKLRGVGHACLTHAERGARHFVSSSGGNAGVAVAYCGRMLHIPVTVVVPETTSARALELLRLEGAEVIVHGQSWAEANTLAQSMLDAHTAFIHPFDDPLLWHGHASLVDEVAEAGIKPDAVVLSVGGGGLLCGVAEGMHRQGWDDVPIIAAETHGMASYARSLEADAVVALPAVTGIATSLGAKQPSSEAVAWSRRLPISSVEVSDREAVTAALQLLTDHRVLVEPACGAALAAVEKNSEELAAAKDILIVVCGGVVATLAQLQDWERTLA
ncbi:pyridoxal-phosphate dependent enzyme [Cupriavidus pampae]|nr:pyridoxal-phosphate dependent enzyme [Cupriavidus pampae]